jgi:hypothetical protein
VTAGPLRDGRAQSAALWFAPVGDGPARRWQLVVGIRAGAAYEQHRVGSLRTDAEALAFMRFVADPERLAVAFLDAARTSRDTTEGGAT